MLAPCAAAGAPARRHGDPDPSYGAGYIMARRATETIAWADFAKTAETGDIVLYSGQSTISNLIRFAEGWSQWSHIGMIVRQTATAPEADRIMIWEATTADGEVDLMSGQRLGGVRLVDAEHAIRAYLRSAENAMIVVRHLYIDETVLGREVNPAARLPDLRRFMDQVAHMPYERSPFEMARALARGLQLVTTWRTGSSYFCSELVAQSYMTLGLLRDDDPAHPTASPPPDEADPRGGDGAARAPRAGASEATPPTGFGGWLKEWFELASRRSASLYTPKDFAQESQNIPFLYDKRTNTDLVALGPHLRVVFPDAGPDPLSTAPPRMRQPQRPPLRMANVIPATTTRKR